MDISPLKKLIFIFLFLFFNNSFAVPVIFKTNKSILVRTPQGVVAKPGIGELLSTVPGAGSSAFATGSFPVSIGSASIAVPVSKSYTAASIAATAADAILSKTAVGLVAALALPYVIDQATDLFMKQVEAQSYIPLNTLAPVPSNAVFLTQDGLYGQSLESWLAIRNNPFCAVTVWTCYYQINPNNPGFVSVYGVPKSQPTACTGTMNNGYCREACTSPSVYDSATGQCLGSAINEPANVETLAADIEETFNDNPTFPKFALDAVLNVDKEPANGQQEINMLSPQTIQGETKTSIKNYHDPATGHPVTEETISHTDYQVEKTAPNQLDVKPNVTTTLNITDNITNTTTTTTNITETTPSEATTETPSETDCDKYPDAVGCLELGDTGTPDELQTSNVDVSINPASWGSGSCPADVAVAGHFMTGAFFSYAPVCQFLSSLAPALIGLGWFIAGWFVLGGVRD